MTRFPLISTSITFERRLNIGLYGSNMSLMYCKADDFCCGFPYKKMSRSVLESIRYSSETNGSTAIDTEPPANITYGTLTRFVNSPNNNDNRYDTCDALSKNGNWWSTILKSLLFIDGTNVNTVSPYLQT